MKEISREKLKSILDKHYENTKELSIEILDEFKNCSRDYGDLKRKLEIFKKTTFFERAGIKKYENLFFEVEEMLKEEMNGLPLTNRSRN